jgi:hypothetical protein
MWRRASEALRLPVWDCAGVSDDGGDARGLEWVGAVVYARERVIGGGDIV